MGRKYFLWGMIIMLPGDHALCLFLKFFDLNREPEGIRLHDRHAGQIDLRDRFRRELRRSRRLPLGLLPRQAGEAC